MQGTDLRSILYGPLHLIDGVAFREVGAGAPLVLLHGGVGSRSHWVRNVQALSRRFTVITVDLPGFGESTVDVTSVSNDEFVGRVGVALSSRLGQEPFKLAAFSFGAAVGCAALHGFGLRPERIALIAPAGFGADAERELGLERLPREPTSDEELRGTIVRNLGRSLLSSAPDVGDEVVDLHLANLASTRYNSRRLSMRESLLQDLRCITRPILCIWGEDDVFPWPSLSERVAAVRRSVPQVDIRLIRGGGHWILYEAAAAVNAALLDFFAS